MKEEKTCSQRSETTSGGRMTEDVVMESDFARYDKLDAEAYHMDDHESRNYYRGFGDGMHMGMRLVLTDEELDYLFKEEL